jgi:hypothetical protein
MNKKLLFAAMSLAAFTACTNDDFESQSVAEEVGNVQFEVINDDITRAAMNGSGLVWNANDNDLFTLYHGATLGAVTGFENATYKADANDEGAKLTTPSMIKVGGAVMFWPVDTLFRVKSSDKLTITIPAEQIPGMHGSVEDMIPYVSDLINISDQVVAAKGKDPGYNNAGLNRKYPVFMRPMASQLTVNADYGTTENELKTLYTAGAEGLYGEDAITAISVKSVSLLTDNSGSDKFTKTIPVKFTGPATYGVTAAQWNKANNAWNKVTDFNISDITVNGEQVDKLTTKCLTGNESSKFLILPQSVISDGVDKGAVEVNTYYGKVLIAKKADYTASKYSDDEYDKAWYRIVSSAKNETTEENASTPGTGKHVGKFKVVAKSTALGMQQTINDFSDHKAGSGYVKGEPTGYALTRYVNVDLTKLDMSDLHVTNDKQLRDVVRVWKKMGLGTVTVYLDGDSNGEFEISQKTIKVINAVNADAAKEETPRSFSVKPCHVTTPDEDCNTIVITGANEIANVQDLTFIKYNDVNGNGSFDTGDVKADVALKAGETWNWAASTTAVKKVTVDATNCGINSFINRGTFVSNATATLAIYDNASTPAQVNTIPFINAAKANFNVNAGTLNVQFNVTNNGTVTIAQNAQ